MKELKYKDKYIFREGYAYAISISENNLPESREDLKSLIGTKFIIDKQEKTLKGVEMFAVENIGDKVSFWLD